MFKARVDELADVLLQTDINAIAANDDHVVFTIRLSREFLRDNHAFLGAISDFAGGADLPKRQRAPPAPEISMAAPKPRARSRIRALMAGALVTLAAVVTRFATLLDRGVGDPKPT